MKKHKKNSRCSGGQQLIVNHLKWSCFQLLARNLNYAIFTLFFSLFFIKINVKQFLKIIVNHLTNQCYQYISYFLLSGQQLVNNWSTINYYPTIEGGQQWGVNNPPFKGGGLYLTTPQLCDRSLSGQQLIINHLTIFLFQKIENQNQNSSVSTKSYSQNNDSLSTTDANSLAQFLIFLNNLRNCHAKILAQFMYSVQQIRMYHASLFNTIRFSKQSSCQLSVRFADILKLRKNGDLINENGVKMGVHYVDITRDFISDRHFFARFRHIQNLNSGGASSHFPLKSIPTASVLDCDMSDRCPKELPAHVHASNRGVARQDGGKATAYKKCLGSPRGENLQSKLPNSSAATFAAKKPCRTANFAYLLKTLAI